MVPDRRGRGMSGPYGDAVTRVVDREAADIRAVIAQVGARDLFGLSTGALVSLGSVLGTTSVTRLALYEPPLSVGGSIALGWMGRYEREIAAGKTSSALITVMRGLRVDRIMSRVPHAVAPLMDWMLHRERPAPGDVAIRDLVPTFHYDVGIVEETADRVGDYASVQADVLLIGGGKEPGVSRPLPGRTASWVAQLPPDDPAWTRTSGCGRPTRSRRRRLARLLQGLRRHDIAAGFPLSMSDAQSPADDKPRSLRGTQH